MAKQATVTARSGSKKKRSVRASRRAAELIVHNIDGRISEANTGRVQAVMAAAERTGLLEGKSGRIGGRVSPTLVKRAKARTGIEADTDLIEFALANVALEDKFAESFKAVRGTVDPDLMLGF